MIMLTPRSSERILIPMRYTGRKYNLEGKYIYIGSRTVRRGTVKKRKKRKNNFNRT